MDLLFIGATVTIYARQLKITEYGDVHTRKKFESEKQRTFAMIKPDAYTNLGKIIDATYANGYSINKLRMAKLDKNTVGEFYAEHRSKPFYGDLESFMTSDVVVGMELVADNVIEKWRETIGPTNT
jgi:nucleoside-diphosphate kinase